jgi:hypothetical protein
LPAPSGFRAGISLAAAGDMALSRRGASGSHGQFLGAKGIPAGAACALRQVHSRRVLILDADPDPAELARTEADGMVTSRAGLFLTVTVADCLPVILFDRRTGAFGLVHSGWKGTGIVVEALRAMAERFGSCPTDVLVTIGPGIGACCYTVPQERADRFAAEFGPASVVSDGGPRLDLRAANVALLQHAGVREITVIRDCTSCTPALGSFRRQGPEAYTLMVAWVGRSPS